LHERSEAEVGSLSDEFELGDLLGAVSAMSGAEPPVHNDRPRDSDGRQLGGDGRDPRNVGPQRTRLDLLAESKRIREECNDFLRRYQEALGARTSPRRAAPESFDGTPTHEPRSVDAARRRKALLLLLIEELV
jgi:hypothetical protein